MGALILYKHMQNGRQQYHQSERIFDASIFPTTYLLAVADLMISMNSGFKEAPPTKNPSMSA